MCMNTDLNFLHMELDAEFAASNEDKSKALAITNRTVFHSPFGEIHFDARKHLKLGDYRRNPVMAAGHSLDPDDVIGKFRDIHWTDKGLEVSPEFAPDDRSQALKAKWDGGYLRALSVGFSVRPGQLKFEYDEDRKIYIDTYGDSDLREISLVAAGRDPGALKMSAVLTEQFSLRKPPADENAQRLMAAFESTWR